MIIRDKDKDVLEVEMFHIVNVGKTNALANFRVYLNQILAEFERELTKTVYQSVATGAVTDKEFTSPKSHIILP
jgi:hypothetical protein